MNYCESKKVRRHRGMILARTRLLMSRLRSASVELLQKTRDEFADTEAHLHSALLHVGRDSRRI